MQNTLTEVSKHFQFEGVVGDITPVTDGLINDTYLVQTLGTAPNYILQRKNKSIFENIPAMMDNILKVTTHLKHKIEQQGGDPLRETLTIIPTHQSALYYEDNESQYWAACYLIPNTVTHSVADTLQLAYEGGAGIGKFQSMLADMTDTLTDILPGFHNMRFRFEQWDQTLAKDPLGRKKYLSQEIAWIEQRRDQMLHFWAKAESKQLPTRITHNDTKISNMLFDSSGKVLAVIDLDTVLNSICLNDYGDAIRSYANTGKEDDTCLDNVGVDMTIFEAYTNGYLSQAISFLTPIEIENLAFSARYITFEQVLRFLMDYIDGDNYYKIASEQHNLVRTHAQYKLLESIEENYPQMCQIISNQIKKLSV